jgi:hypothetical protein
MNRNEATRRNKPEGILVLFAIVCGNASFGQHAQRLTTSHEEPIKRLYVDSFEGKTSAAQLRERLIARLRSDRKWQIVDRPEEADAVVHGNGETWVKGYISMNPRSKSLHQPAYGGCWRSGTKAGRRCGPTL